jgi:hypothetical protein
MDQKLLSKGSLRLGESSGHLVDHAEVIAVKPPPTAVQR